MLFRLGGASFLVTWQIELMLFSDDLDVLAILIGLSVYAICCIILIHSCFLKCAYLVTPCAICVLLSVFCTTNLRSRGQIFSSLIIVLHCIKDPLYIRTVHYLNLFNCTELLISYAMLLFWCAFVPSILKVTYLLTYIKYRTEPTFRY